MAGAKEYERTAELPADAATAHEKGNIRDSHSFTGDAYIGAHVVPRCSRLRRKGVVVRRSHFMPAHSHPRESRAYALDIDRAGAGRHPAKTSSSFSGGAHQTMFRPKSSSSMAGRQSNAESRCGTTGGDIDGGSV